MSRGFFERSAQKRKAARAARQKEIDEFFERMKPRSRDEASRKSPSSESPPPVKKWGRPRKVREVFERGTVGAALAEAVKLGKQRALTIKAISRRDGEAPALTYKIRELSAKVAKIRAEVARSVKGSGVWIETPLGALLLIDVRPDWFTVRGEDLDPFSISASTGKIRGAPKLGEPLLTPYRGASGSPLIDAKEAEITHRQALRRPLKKKKKRGR